MTFEIARRCVQLGDSVEWFSAAFPAAPAREEIDGVQIVRRGRQWSVHWCAFRHYRGKLKQNFDVVIDEINTIPFFTPLWSDIPSVVLIHQLAREVWWYESSFPWNLAGFLAEPIYLRLYRAQVVMTVSRSTRDDLRRLGFTGKITVIPEGVEPIYGLGIVKSSDPNFVFVGRLAPSKRVADLIRAFAAFVRRVGSGDLYLLGDGSTKYVEHLRHMARAFGLSTRIHFLGRVPTLEKHRAMAQASALLMASVREGWGLVVTEANALGTPAIGYDVPGLRDSIKHLETGLLVKPEPEALTEAMLQIWLDVDLRTKLASNASKWSSSFSFERTAAVFRDGLADALAGHRLTRPGHQSATRSSGLATNEIKPHSDDDHR